jgi:hypothetical protein
MTVAKLSATLLRFRGNALLPRPSRQTRFPALFGSPPTGKNSDQPLRGGRFPRIKKLNGVLHPEVPKVDPGSV